ncbi:MAG: DUF4340 domain-containing protein [Sandaracinus sp.]|nr:DUF4340 domain-containing protein [Sandaracinus sp.]
MNQQTKMVAALVAFFVLAGGATYVIVKRSGEEETQVADQNLPTLPEVDRDAITELTVTRPAQEEGGAAETVKLVKRGETWFVVEPIEAEADGSAVDTALSRLAELELTGIAATNPDNHERLEVSDDKAILVTAKAGDETVLTLRIGAYRGRSTMARLEGDDRVLALRGSIKFAFNKALKDWRNKKILDEAPEEVVAVRFENGNGTFSFLRNGEGAWTQAEGETPIERFGSTRVQSLVSSLANMRAVDFAAADVDHSAAGFDEPSGTVTLEIREGDAPAPTPAEEGAEEAPAPTRTIRLQIGGSREGNEHYVRVEGDETIYVVSQYLADRARPAMDAFQEAEPGSEPELPPEMPPGLGGPGGGLGGPGGGQIPPELMEQIQRQLQAASMM